MSWQVPVTTDTAWKGKPWQELEFLNHLVRATNMRLLTVWQLTAGSHGDPIPEVVEGDPIQSVDFFRTLRDTAFIELANVAWVQPGDVDVGDDPTMADRLYCSGGEWTQLFVDAVNSKLAEFSCPAMGTTILSGGAIPWTRMRGPAYADPPAFVTDYGPFSAGDWQTGRHLYNEWRAALEVLTDVYRVPEMSTDNDEEIGYSGSSVEDESCADAKANTNAAWDSYSPVGASIVRAAGSTSGSGTDWQAEFSRTWVRYVLTKANLTNGVETTLWAVARPPPSATFNAFGEGWADGEVGQVVTAGAPDGTTANFDVDPFSAGSCDIDSVHCSISGASEAEGYQVEVEGVLYTLEYPEPAYTAPTPDPFYPA